MKTHVFSFVCVVIVPGAVSFKFIMPKFVGYFLVYRDLVAAELGQV